MPAIRPVVLPAAKGHDEHYNTEKLRTLARLDAQNRRDDSRPAAGGRHRCRGHLGRAVSGHQEQRPERADAGHHHRPVDRQHRLSGHRQPVCQRHRLHQGPSAAHRHRALRSAPDLPGHRPGRHGRCGDRCAGAVQHLFAGAVDRPEAAGHGQAHHHAGGGRRLHLRRCRRAGHRTRGQGPCRGRGRGRGHRGGVRHHRHLSLPGAVPLECRVRLDRHQHAAVRRFRRLHCA